MYSEDLPIRLLFVHGVVFVVSRAVLDPATTLGPGEMGQLFSSSFARLFSFLFHMIARIAVSPFFDETVLVLFSFVVPFWYPWQLDNVCI